MVMSIEHVFVRQCPKSAALNGGSVFRGSANPLKLADILVVLGYVQRTEPIGSMVLNAQITNDKTDRQRLVIVMTGFLRSKAIPRELANALAEAVVHEVCDTNTCSKCKGTGFRPGSSTEVCSKCEGIGREQKSERAIVRYVNRYLTTQTMSRHAFRERWYQPYMEAIDRLNVEANNAVHAVRARLKE